MKEDKDRYLSDIESYHGSIPLWLILVIITLLIWAVYYVIEYWGGLGPGIN